MRSCDSGSIRMPAWLLPPTENSLMIYCSDTSDCDRSTAFVGKGKMVPAVVYDAVLAVVAVSENLVSYTNKVRIFIGL